MLAKFIFASTCRYVFFLTNGKHISQMGLKLIVKQNVELDIIIKLNLIANNKDVVR